MYESPKASFLANKIRWDDIESDMRVQEELLMCRTDHVVITKEQFDRVKDEDYELKVIDDARKVIAAQIVLPGDPDTKYNTRLKDFEDTAAADSYKLQRAI